jgi:signal transduction histidine kinase
VTTSLRSRLLVAFVLVSLPPLLVLGAFFLGFVRVNLEAGLDERLASGTDRIQDRIQALRGEIGDALVVVAEEDLLRTPPDPGSDRTIAETIGGRRNLPALVIVDASGRVISSRQWPAGYNLPQPDTFLGDDLRLARVASGSGATERLALMPSRPAYFRGEPVTLSGGVFLDQEFLLGPSSATGLLVAFRDVAGRRWIARPGFPLDAWNPPLGTGGEATDAAGTRYRFLTRLLTPALGLAVASPRTSLDRLESWLLRTSFGVAALATGIALGAAVLLSKRIARPVGALAEQARRVAEGDLSGRVAVTSSDEIGQLSLAFNAMTEDLQLSQDRLLRAERVAAWREIGRRLAHDLKNPLFPVQLSIETLRRAFEGRRVEPEELSALVRESTGTILDELAVLKRIIEEFSEFARTPRPRLAPVDPSALVESVVSLYRPRAEGITIETDLRPLPPLPADRDLLHRALSNLVANAIEAVPPGGTVRVSTRAEEGATLIEVSDTGPGLTPEQESRLFTPYYTTKKGGTGLGLAIVQGIVSDHGGRIEVKTAPGEGTRFTLAFPGTKTV